MSGVDATQRKSSALTQVPQLLTKLNIGCGNWFDRSWVNIDLFPAEPQVTQHDVAQGLPFADQSFDVVYHSHLLEHLTPEDGTALMLECFRVLKPGGILRVVVPDLEQIAQLYLEQHVLACQGDPLAKANYEWMKLELLDQMVRLHSGGRMGRFITSPKISNPEFVLSRLGAEYDFCISAGEDSANQDVSSKQGLKKKPGKSANQAWKDFRYKLASRLVQLLLGRKARRAFEEGVFRSQGEVHRWMYDRYSLKQLCEECGFTNGKPTTAFESEIEGFKDFGLDSIKGIARKPDSLFFECRKPAVESVSEDSADLDSSGKFEALQSTA